MLQLIHERLNFFFSYIYMLKSGKAYDKNCIFILLEGTIILADELALQRFDLWPEPILHCKATNF